MTAPSTVPFASASASLDAGMTVGMAPRRCKASASIALLARNFLPLEGTERSDRLAAVDDAGIGCKSSNHVEILISAQCLGRDQLGISEGALAGVAKQTGQFEQLVVGKSIGRLPGYDPRDVRDPFEDHPWLLGERSPERAVWIDLDGQNPFSLGIDRINKRFDSVFVCLGVFGREERECELDRLGGGRERQ